MDNYKTSLPFLSIDNGVGAGCAAMGASWEDYGVTWDGVEETGSEEEEGEILCCGRGVNNGPWIWSGNVSAPSWECPSPRRHGCRRSLPEKGIDTIFKNTNKNTKATGRMNNITS